MTTCCEQNAPYTGCNQGRDCPVGWRRITSEQTFEAARLMDTARQAALMQVPVASAIPGESGNIQFAGAEPDDHDGTPVFFTRTEMAGFAVVVLVVVAIWFVGLGTVAGYAWGLLA